MPRVVLRLCLVLVPLVMLLLAPGATAAETEPRGVWPLQPRPEVVRGFDPPAEVWSSGHRGVDLRGSIGQDVHAARAGRVSWTGRIAGVEIVVVDHGSTRTTYQPVAPGVTVGDRVRAGDVIGTLQWFGTHCLPNPCLHWGLVRGEEYLDPLSLVDGPSPVRLLPLGEGPAVVTHRSWPAPRLPRLLPWGRGLVVLP